MADTTYKPTTGDTVRDMKDQAREFATDVSESASDAASRVKDTASEVRPQGQGHGIRVRPESRGSIQRGHRILPRARDAGDRGRRQGLGAQHPAQALIGAAVVGFLAAALLRRR